MQIGCHSFQSGCRFNESSDPGRLTDHRTSLQSAIHFIQLMATAPVQPNRSQKLRMLQAPEKAPASLAHATASVKASSVAHAHEKVRVSPGVKPSASNQAMQRMVRGRVLQRKL